MPTLTPSKNAQAIRFEYLNWVASDPLPRDQSQSLLLHEPTHRTNSTDPMNGHDIHDVASHPSLIDGNLTLYFENESTRAAYKDMEFNHPNLRLPYKASMEDDRGG